MSANTTILYRKAEPVSAPLAGIYLIEIIMTRITPPRTILQCHFGF